MVLKSLTIDLQDYSEQCDIVLCKYVHTSFPQSFSPAIRIFTDFHFTDLMQAYV